MKKIMNSKLSRIICLLNLCLLCACAAGRPPLPAEAISEAFALPARAETTPVVVPDEVGTALLPELTLESAIALPSAEPRFDIATNNTPAREFFMGLVAGTPYNMAVHPQVSGEISLSLKKVTVPEVMRLVGELYGYEFLQTETGYQVYPFGLQTRIFQVDYLNLSRKGLSQTRVSSGQVTQSSERDNNNNNNNNNNKQPATVLGSQIDTTSNADFWQELEKALYSLIGSDDGRKVVVQPQAGVVIVRAMPTELRELAGYLASIQGNLQRQVILEAKIIEVELNDGFQSGINWVALGSSGKNNSILFGQTAGGMNLTQSSFNLTGQNGNFGMQANSPNPNFDVASLGGVFSAALKMNDFAAFIELLETQGNVEVLSSPRISTLNNQKAVIKVGTDEFFVTGVSSTTVTGTTTTTTPEVTLTPFFSGIALDVTPQIDESGRVTLHIHPTVSEVIDQTKLIKIANQDQSLPLALSSVRESDSVVSAQSGQIVVIGGLMQNSTTKNNASVPLLGRIPLVGALFRHTKETSRKSELVILLRPVVVQGQETWNEALLESRQRIERLQSNIPTSNLFPSAKKQ
jgi:MSHA biogenesis protein MshL